MVEQTLRKANNAVLLTRIQEEISLICYKCREEMTLVYASEDGVESRWVCPRCGYTVTLYAVVKPEGVT